VAIKTATKQDTYEWIFGSGLDTYSWWHEMRPEFDYGKDGSAPDDWLMVVRFEDPGEEDEVRTASVRHADIMRAVRKIARGNVRYAGKYLAKECRNMIFDVDAVDVDAGDADCILQVAVMGAIVYG
jgi:hypothetical protein